MMHYAKNMFGTLSAVLLAGVLFTGSALCSLSVWAAETAGQAAAEEMTETVTEEMTEAVTEAVSEAAAQEENEQAYELPPAPDFTLTDQFGAQHTLADYEGKIIFLNIWATWCPPCRSEMPDIQELYEKYKDSDEVQILAVAFPKLSGEKDVEGIAAFLEDNGYTYPVLMDARYELMYQFGIAAYPTTFMITSDGRVYGYVQGAMDKETMEDIIAQTLAYDSE